MGHVGAVVFPGRDRPATLADQPVDGNGASTAVLLRAGRGRRGRRDLVGRGACLPGYPFPARRARSVVPDRSVIGADGVLSVVRRRGDYHRACPEFVTLLA